MMLCYFQFFDDNQIVFAPITAWDDDGIIDDSDVPGIIASLPQSPDLYELSECLFEFDEDTDQQTIRQALVACGHIEADLGLI